MNTPAPMVTTFEATPAQAAFIDNCVLGAFDGRYHIGGYGGGIRGGKTWGGIGALIVLLQQYPGSRAAIVRKDLPTLRRNTIPSVSRLRQTCRAFLGDLNQSTWTYPCANGSELLLFPESAPTDPDRDRWKGLEVNWILFEEGNECQDVSFRKAIERAGALVIPGIARQPYPLVLVTFNPSPGWVRYTFYEPWKHGSLPPTTFYQPALVADNPHIPASYRSALRNLPPEEYKRFVEGDWDVVSGAFFAQLADSAPPDGHVVPSYRPAELPTWWTYWGGYDWGYRHNAVFTALAKGGDGRTVVLDTVWMHKLSDDEQADRIVTQLDSSLGEPARRAVTGTAYAGTDAFSQRRAHEAAVRTVADVFLAYDILLERAHTSRVPGWREVRNQIQRVKADGAVQPPALVFADTPGNRRLLAAMRDLLPDPKHPEDVLKVDADLEGNGGDDGPDALRYGVATPALAGLAPAPAVTDEDGRRDPTTFTWRPPEAVAAERTAGEQFGQGW